MPQSRGTSIKRVVPQTYFAFSVLCFILQIIAVAGYYWVKIEANSEEEFVGLFYSSSTSIRSVSCNTDTSETECGYLRCAQISGVITLLFSAATVRGYYLFTNDFESHSVPGLKWFIASVFGIITSIFNLICVVVFHYYKSTYLTQNDDTNIEYPSIEKIDESKFQWSYWLMVFVTVILLALSLSNIALNFDRVLRCLNISAHHKDRNGVDLGRLLSP
jgi:hypothetical protein